MAARGAAALERKSAASPAGGPRRAPQRAAGRKGGAAPAGAAGSAWARAWRAGLLAMLLGGLAAALGIHFAGHAPSWRSLNVLALQSLPLLPGIALFWRAMEWLRSRRPSLSLTLWLALAFLGTMAAMIVASGLVFAAHNRVLAFRADHGGHVAVMQHLIGVAEAFYLYLTTAFRLWWPFGALVPTAVAVLFWRAHRR